MFQCLTRFQESTRKPTAKASVKQGSTVLVLGWPALWLSLLFPNKALKFYLMLACVPIASLNA